MPNTWFVQHWPKHEEWGEEENKRVQQRLFDKREVGIHYQDICSLDPENYQEKFRQYIQRFCRLASMGGYVFANYPAISKTLVGKIQPNSRIKKCNNSKFHYIKRLIIKEDKEIVPPMRHILLTGRPPFTTLCIWHIIGSNVEDIVEGRNQEPSWSLLNTSQQEAVCQEYLRHKHDLKYLLLASGGNMQDIDILGITDKEKGIVAQVKYEETEEKLRECVKRLSEFPKHNRFVFCGKQKLNNPAKLKREFNGRVNFVWTDEVESWLKSQPVYEKALFGFLK